MANGVSASLTLGFTGASPSTWGQEVDLAVDAAGDLLTIDAAGDALIVSPAITWTGRGAAAAIAEIGASAAADGGCAGASASAIEAPLTGAAASLAWPPVRTITTEGGLNLLAEAGGTIATEIR